MNFIVNLLLVFVRYALYRDRQDIFCRLLTLNRGGFSFYLISQLQKAGKASTPHAGRHFIVILLLLFVRLTVPRRRCRDRQKKICRLLTLTDRLRRGVEFYLILHMSRALSFIYSERRVRLDVFWEV